MTRRPRRHVAALAALLTTIAMVLPAEARANPIVIGPGPLQLLGLPLVVAIEVPIVAAFFPGRRRRIALTCAAATALTYFLLHWFLVTEQYGVPTLVVGEALAMLAEAAVYARVTREARRALVASAVANLASFGAGLALAFALSLPLWY